MRLQECFKGMVVLIVVLLLFAGCEQATTPSASSSLTYVPLSVGNWWIFDTRQIDSTGNIVVSGYQYFDSTVTVTRTMVNGRPTFTLLSFWTDTSGRQVRVDTFVVALENETFWLSSRHLLNRLQDLQLPLPEWIPVANFLRQQLPVLCDQLPAGMDSSGEFSGAELASGDSGPALG